MVIKVVNKKVYKGPGEYIGRPSPLGNPFTHRPLKDTLALYWCKSIQEAVEKHEVWLRQKIKAKDPDICNELNRLYKIAKGGNDLILICWCLSPTNCYCHGNTVKKILEEKLTPLGRE